MTKKYRKLSHEILGLIGIAAGISLILFLLLSFVATGVIEEYVFNHDIPMTEFDWIAMEHRILTVSTVLSCISFSVLFLFLLKDRIAYIRKITEGIDALHDPSAGVSIPLEGNNELTALARAINEMSQVRQQLRQREQALAEEKEQLVRSLSHDIRTPLTSILAYSELLAQQAEGEQKAQLNTIRSKAEQIRDLTAVLLDGTRRNLEQFENGRLLMEQIVSEFEEELEDQFDLSTDFGHCPAFSARLDVQELRRIFDNLASNIRKYADPTKPVILEAGYDNGSLLIRQTNSILPPKEQHESYGIGLSSIRRIAQHYGGSVTTEESTEQFIICILLRDL